MAKGEYCVCQFFVDDSYERVLDRVDAETAVDTFFKLIRSVGAKLGTTRRVIVTDGGDSTNMEWVHGQGVVYPPEVAARWSEVSKGSESTRVNVSIPAFEDGSDLLDAADEKIRKNPTRIPALDEAFAKHSSDNEDPS